MRRPGIAATLVVAIAVAATIGIGGYILFRPPQTEIRSGGVVSTGVATIGGPFSLTDQNGQRRSEQDLKGRYALVYFGYTFCPDACPRALFAVSQALARLREEGVAVADDVLPILISVDPARDTQEQLKAYASNFDPALLAMTGSDAEVAEAAKAYRVSWRKVETEGASDYLVDHTTLLYLMGPDGRFLRHFDHTAQATDLAAALRELPPLD